jgi:DNA-binding phage protein
LNRESLYKALGGSGNPELSTVMRVTKKRRVSEVDRQA